ncbi:TonB-dependent siderophore receptor [Sphingobium sp. Sx8-8]|uniref:TonB-dependent siderophore receptor n=1 Tax=Sphingobium sp. Sx8-8 TaxID=2933617 RepID=UPI001F566F8D|nr:TonB-dependent siderophore receptor [Sphingobium sp. Sx8-8]
MSIAFRTALLSSTLAACWALPAHADTVAEADNIIVTGAVTDQNASATGLALTLRETPQSLTVIDRERIEDFALTNVNDLLAQTVGINVERVETDRTYYNARGFDITNFQVDGIGLPLRWGIQFGDLDTALFENVEAIRGANAIMTGVGNPSATINYVRKKPTQDFHASASAMLGSWNQKRVEADISGPVNASGTVSARLIFAHEDRDSWLRYNHVNRNVYGAMVDWEITPRLKASAGYTRQDNDADGVLWGALPLLDSNGGRIAYPRSASTSADWTYWNVTDQSAWAELAYAFGNGWNARGRFTYNHRDSSAELLYAYGYPDAATGVGIAGMAGRYRSPFDQYLGDFYASGPVTLFGREHQLAFGLSTGKTDGYEYQQSGLDTVTYPAVSQWAFNRTTLTEPDFAAETLEEDVTDRLTRAYGALHANLSDRLKAVAGASIFWLKTTGSSYGTDQYRKDSKVSPYLGLVFDATANISLYASYTGIYNPQDKADFNNRRLDPARGTSVEGGIKSEWFDKRLYASAAVFRARQKNLAERAGVFGAGDPGPVGDVYYAGVDTTARGFEIEMTGMVTDRWSVSGGYTGLKIEDQDGNRARTYLPRQSLKLATTYAIPEFRDLKLGAQLRWQSDVSTTDTGLGRDVVIRQKDYAVLDLMASVRLLDRLKASVNVRNVTDTKYLSSLMWGQAYYAAPRSVMGTLRFEY